MHTHRDAYRHTLTHAHTGSFCLGPCLPHVDCRVPSWGTKWFQYELSSEKIRQWEATIVCCCCNNQFNILGEIPFFVLEDSSLLAWVTIPCSEELCRDWLSWFQTTFLIKISWCFTIWFQTAGILLNHVCTVLFIICLSITRVIVIPKIFYILQWKDISNFFDNVSCKAFFASPK